MKKYLFSALALPLLFACSTDDFEKPVASNDPYPGIEKVNATFYMDEGPVTRMESEWKLEVGDVYGFAWMGEGELVTQPAEGLGLAYQNHNLIQTNVPELGGDVFMPQTSIYVGDYFIYRPYDYETVSPTQIKFKSLVNQPLAEGYASSTEAWKGLAKSAIIIGDKWTNITPEGRTYPNPDTPNNPYSSVAGGDWDLPGIGNPYKVFAAVFSNQTGLDLAFANNNPKFANGTNIWGATDIDITFGENDEAGAADIYQVKVALDGASNSFSYGPKQQPTAEHSGTYWADKSGLGEDQGFTFNIAQEAQVDPGQEQQGDPDPANTITLTPDDKFETSGEHSEGAWFWFNSLPVISGEGTVNTEVETKFSTSYGLVTVTKKMFEQTQAGTDYCAYEFVHVGNVPGAINGYKWIPLTNQNSLDGHTAWNIGTHNTFINQYGNHKGKFKFTVDFATADMSVVHIQDDEHLQKLLKFYIASGKNDPATLPLDNKEGDGIFKLSKISIALLQTINRNADADHKVKVRACGEHGTNKIIITQDGQEALGLADKTEVPTLDEVFAEQTAVYLSSECEWTWGGDYSQKDEVAQNNQALTIDGNVASLTNEGHITVNAINVQLNAALYGDATAEPTIYNANNGTIDITKVTTVKSTLNNLGTINVGDDNNKNAEFRAYGINITNDAKDILTPENIIAKDPDGAEVGVINNWGVVGVSDGTPGKFYNYGGMIYMRDDAAMTFLTSNELIGAGTSAFSSAFDADANKMGVVVLPNNNPYAIVSVNNEAENGFITIDWTDPTYEHDPGNVKYNTIIVSDDITFTGAIDDPRATEIQFIMINGEKIKVVNPGTPLTASRLSNLKGVIVPDGKSFILEKTNRLNCKVGAFVGGEDADHVKAAIYKGGELVLPENAIHNYFGDWTMDQIVKY